MLNGIDPIIIFQFSKLSPEASTALARVPVISKIPTLVDAPPIPVYLSEEITGVYIDTEDKTIEIETTVEGKADGATPDVSQKPLGETLTINLVGNKNSLGLTLLSAMSGLILDKAISKEYAITYLHGAITIFRGLLNSFAVTQQANSDLLQIKIELSRGEVKTPKKPDDVPIVPKVTGVVPL